MIEFIPHTWGLSKTLEFLVDTLLIFNDSATGTLIACSNLLGEDSDNNPETPLAQPNKHLISLSREAIEDLLHFVVMQS